MKLLPGKWLQAGARCALTAAAALALAACAETGISAYPGYSSDSNWGAATSTPGYYRVKGRYYHCHPGGICHNQSHPNYYWNGSYYRPRPPRYYSRPVYPNPVPIAPPPRPRPR